MDVSYIDYLTFGLILFEIFWVSTDPRGVKERIKAYFQPKTILIAFFTAAFVLLNYLSGVYFPLPYSNFEGVGFMLGMFLYAFGIVLCIWAKLTMKKNWGMPGQHDVKRQNKLVNNGPFKYTRNPIYLGFTMFLLGYGFLLQSYFTFLVLIAIWYFYKSAGKEEKLLEKHFGKEYLEYKERVPRFI